MNLIQKIFVIIKNNIIYVLFFPAFLLLVALLEIAFLKSYPSLDSSAPEIHFLYWVFTISLTWFVTKVTISKIIFPLISNFKKRLLRKKDKSLSKDFPIKKKILTYFFYLPIIWATLIFILLIFRGIISEMTLGAYALILSIICLWITKFFVNKRFFNVMKIILKSILLLLVLIAIVIPLYWIGFNLYLTPKFYRVEDKSMLPTLKTGELITCDKFDKNKHRLNYKDIVVFEHKKQEIGTVVDADNIKRIVALPGDKILITKELFYLNNKFQNEEYLNYPLSTILWKEGFIKDGKEITVTNNHFLILGDNRPYSSDSREFGFISKNDISCYISWEKQSKYKNRWKMWRDNIISVKNNEGKEYSYIKFNLKQSSYWCSESLKEPIQNRLIIISDLEKILKDKNIDKEISNKLISDSYNYLENMLSKETSLCWKD